MAFDHKEYASSSCYTTYIYQVWRSGPKWLRLNRITYIKFDSPSLNSLVCMMLTRYNKYVQSLTFTFDIEKQRIFYLVIMITMSDFTWN